MYYEQSMTLVNDIYQMEATVGNKLKLMQEVLIWSLRTSESYVDDIGMEPLREDKAVREVESHHKPCHESSSRSDAGVVVDPVQSDSSRSPSPPPGALAQRCTTKPLVTSKV
jgi:hypothetical protein